MSDTADGTALNSGSRWQRWDPHIHAPGTAMNDQFKGDDAWGKYLDALEAATPTVKAIGVTDYYVTESYEQLLAHKKAGRLKDCELIFPNIELRIGVGTVSGGFVNVHLLVCPDDADHVERIKGFLSQLTFYVHGENRPCTRASLIQLGEIEKPETKGYEKAALEAGATQFKVDLDQLRKTYQDSAWAKANILFGVAGGKGDGSSGVRDAADAALRVKIENFAHIIFASSEQQRRFWLGEGKMSLDDLWTKYGGPKPCLHGCDAHMQADVANPDLDRYSWIKGAAAFDTLHQACIDPGMRAYVGVEPPSKIFASQIIREVVVGDAEWAEAPVIALNPGLVAIIGARGSGKTALADMIAQGCDSYKPDPKRPSFLERAKPLLKDEKVTIFWEGGEEVNRPLSGAPIDPFGYERVRYLSQQFVESLCSSEGLTDGLLAEVERVVFQSHPESQTSGAATFGEYRSDRTFRFQSARESHEEAISTLSQRIGVEQEKRKGIANAKGLVAGKETQITNLENDRKRLVLAGDEARATRLTEVSEAAEKVRAKIRSFTLREQQVLALQDEVSGFRTLQAPEALRRAKEKYLRAGLTEDDWNEFLLDYSGDVGGKIQAGLQNVKSLAESWTGKEHAQPEDPETALIAETNDLARLPLNLLQAEILRLEGLVSTDRDTREKLRAISVRISNEQAQLVTLKERLTDYEGAPERIKELVREREEAYAKVFAAIAGEEVVLNELYAPLKAKLAEAGGSLGKLSFSVTRIADVATWAEAGEQLLDLRKAGRFKGKGTLAVEASKTLKAAWERGSPEEVSAAMATFRDANDKDILEHAPLDVTDPAYREWLKTFATWLYGTSHISIQYSINYDGIDITRLSPGTRGIVLLLLYLALDDKDDRPLIIDQPEENLDPKSVFDELVGLFIAAKAKRQVIVVTHNANLVINTDADQIIIASSKPHSRDSLPSISYVSGGLESQPIRQLVCEILEGGAHAFQERARRLRVKLAR